jgi:hypothetical protein
MNKYRVTLVQTKAIVMEVEGVLEADAIARAKSKIIMNNLFDKRIGTVLTADVQEIKKADE